MLSCEFFRN